MCFIVNSHRDVWMQPSNSREIQGKKKNFLQNLSKKYLCKADIKK